MFVSTQLIHIDTDAIFDMIYPLSAFENCKLTMQEFKKAVAKEAEEDCRDEDKLLAANMEAACMYMLDTLNEPVSVDYAYRINELLTIGRVTGDLKRDYEIGFEDLEYIKILKEHEFDFSGYDLKRIIPAIPAIEELEGSMNITEKEYKAIIMNASLKDYETYAYQCFMPMIRSQYFKKSNIITGALIVCKIVLQTKAHLMFIESKHAYQLAQILLECIYQNEDEPFQKFIAIMEQHHIEMSQKNNVKVMIHYE